MSVVGVVLMRPDDLSLEVYYLAFSRRKRVVGSNKFVSEFIVVFSSGHVYRYDVFDANGLKFPGFLSIVVFNGPAK